MTVSPTARLDIHRDCFVVGNLERFMQTCHKVLPLAFR